MPKFSPQLSGPETKFIRPIAPVQDDSVASAITGLTQVATSAFNIYQEQERQKAQKAQVAKENQFAAEGEQLRSEFEELSESFITQTLPDFETGIRRASKMSKGQMRIRAEALLKEYSAAPGRTPEEIQKLRQIAGQVLGFDPTGTMVALEAERQDDIRKAEELHKKDYIDLGLDMAQYGTPQGEKNYAVMRQQRQHKADLQMQLDIAQATKKYKSIDAPNMLQEYTATSHTQVMSGVNAAVQNTFGKPITEVTDADISGMDSQELRNFELSLEEMRRNLRSDLNERFAPYDNISDSNIEAAMEPIDDYIDMIKGRASLETSLKDLTNQNKFQNQLIESKLWGTPKARPYMILSKQFPNMPMDVGVTDVLLDDVFPILEGKISHQPFGDTQKERTIRNNFTKNLFKAMNESDMTDNQKEVATKVVTGFARSAYATYDDMSQEEKDAMIELYQNPDVADVANKVEATEDINKMNQVTDEYLSSTINGLAYRLTSDFKKPAQFGVRKKITDFVNIKRTANGIQVTPKDRSQDARVQAQLLNKYVTRFNKAMKARANLAGKSVDHEMNALTDQFVGIPGFNEIFGEAEEVLSDTGKKTKEGRPVYENQFGDFVTERTITEEIPSLGGIYNIPTVYDGRFVSPDEAIQLVINNQGKDPITGRKLMKFDNIEDAVNAAKKRSSGTLSEEMRDL